MPDTGSRLRSVVDAFSADWMWVDSLAAFAIAHETREGTTITFWDIDFRTNPYEPVLLPGAWREGPGLVRRPDGHAVVSAADPCGTVAIDLVRATREGRHGPSDLRHYGLDVGGFDACKSTGRALLALDGFAMPSPQRTIDLVVRGALVRIDRRTVAEKLAVRVLDERVAGAGQGRRGGAAETGRRRADRAPARVRVRARRQAVAFGAAGVAELNSSRGGRDVRRRVGRLRARPGPRPAALSPAGGLLVRLLVGVRVGRPRPARHPDPPPREEARGRRGPARAAR